LKLYLLIISLLLVFSVSLYSQNAQSVNIFSRLEQQSGLAKVQIIQDAHLKNLINKHIAINTKNDKIPGWRIRIYSDLGSNARDASVEARTRFLSLYPEIPVYRQYTAPYYKVYVGDLKTRQEVARLLRQIRKDFPNAFPIQTDINFPIMQ
jgi:hypothetical protein